MSSISITMRLHEMLLSRNTETKRGRPKSINTKEKKLHQVDLLLRSVLLSQYCRLYRFCPHPLPPTPAPPSSPLAPSALIATPQSIPRPLTTRPAQSPRDKGGPHTVTTTDHCHKVRTKGPWPRTQPLPYSIRPILLQARRLGLPVPQGGGEGWVRPVSSRESRGFGAGAAAARHSVTTSRIIQRTH